MKARARTTGATFPKAVLAGTAILLGCADLEMEADRVPTELAVSPPDSSRFTVGKPTKLELVVRDQHGEVMPVPGWAPVNWRANPEAVAGVGDDGTLTGRGGGWVGVTARLAGLEARLAYCMNPDRIVLTAPVIYLNQATQNRDGTVRLITGRPALLRVFAVADQVNCLKSSVRVTLTRGGDVVFERLIPPESGRIATSVDESKLAGSYNVEIPGSAIQPGVEMVVELDLEGEASLAAGSQTRYPAQGAMALDVVEPPLYRIVLVPTISRPAPDSAVFDWVDGVNPESEQMRLGRTILPVGDMVVEVHDTYTTSLNLRDFGNWYWWLNEIGVLYEQEGRRGYYYGVVSRNLLGVAGIANLGYPVSVGSDVDYVFTHEVGHTMSLYHAPCGGAGGPDPQYPYDDGSIGVWGYDMAEKTLLDPEQYRDVMGYCFERVWTSDYHFDRAMTHRLNGDGGINHDADTGAPPGADRGEMLVVWGAVREGRLFLEPAFVLEGPVVLPESDGPYRVEGLGKNGETRFSLSFSPVPLAHGGSSFVFFVPYEREWADNLERMVLAGPEGEDTLTRYGESEMAVLTDPSTGRIRSIVRDWDGGPLPGEERANVTVTRGIPTSGLR